MVDHIRRRAPTPLPHGMPRVHPVLERVYARRGVTEARELDLSLHQLLRPEGMADLDRAAGILAESIRQGERIVVVGDYDADGATATALLLRVLRGLMSACGGDPEHIDSFIPDRMGLGYGLSPEVVAHLRSRQPGLLVTVDNGVTSLEGVAAARAAGMRVVVTDHHTPGERLPDADAVVNPLRRDCSYPSPHLAGVGVAFYLALATCRTLERAGASRGGDPPEVTDELDLVALGTVADVVPLDHNNRILVEQGLRRIRAGRCRPGVLALLEASGRDPGTVTAADLAFGAAPRLNAAGRLDDMAAGVTCLTTEDPERARAVAAELDGLNRQRREVEARMTDEALAELEARARDLGLGVCVAADGWHPGVTGLLASRLRERYHRPAVAFAPAGEAQLQGSARSVPGLHMRDLLARIDGRCPGVIERFGGHAMAAGLTIAAGHLSAFREAFRAALDEALDGALPARELETDGTLATGEITLETAHALRYGGPWGNGFPEPAFDGVFAIHDSRELRGGHLRLTLSPPDASAPRWQAIAFRGAERGWQHLSGRVLAVYTPEVNQFRGEVSLQLRIQHLAAAPAAAPEAAPGEALARSPAHPGESPA